MGSQAHDQDTPRISRSRSWPRRRAADIDAAVARVSALLAEWDALKRGDTQGKVPGYPAGTLGALMVDPRGTAEWRDKSKGTHTEIGYAWRTMIEPAFGMARLDAITARVVEAWYAGLRVEGSVHRAARAMKWLRYLLSRAVRLGRLPSNPALAVRVKTPQPRRVPWTEDQVRAVAAAARDLGHPDLEVLILTAHDTGIRPVDPRGLRWGDLAHATLRFVQAKTGRPVETVMDPETVAAIARLRARQGTEPMPSAYLFRTPRGGPWSRDYLVERFRAARETAGLPEGLQLRDLRQTAETGRQEAGATEAEVAAAGHSLKRAGQLRDVYTVTSARMAWLAQAKRRAAKSANRKKTPEA